MAKWFLRESAAVRLSRGRGENGPDWTMSVDRSSQARSAEPLRLLVGRHALSEHPTQRTLGGDASTSETSKAI